MEWTSFRHRSGFTLDHPAGWSVQVLPGPTTIVRSPDGAAFSVASSLHGTGATPGVDILREGLSPAMFLFPDPTFERVTPGENNGASAVLTFRSNAGVACRAQMLYVSVANDGILYASAAPEDRFAELLPTLEKILRSLRAVPPASPDAPAAPARPDADALTYVPFTEPQMGTFTTEVPKGWRVKGGFSHPMPGDRRPWIELNSPDGIYVLCDPEMPQSLCHFPGQPEGVFVGMAAGGQMLNLRPDAAALADYYLQHLTERRVGAFQVVQKRQRPDIVDMALRKLQGLGGALPPQARMTAVEAVLHVQRGGETRAASVLATALFGGEYTMGMWAFWDGNVYLAVAPPQRAAVADQVRARVWISFMPTPRLQQLYAQDEAIITANGAAANAAQWSWFNGQQAVHQAQTAMGDAIVDNYWAQQRSNDAMARAWEQGQGVYDRASEARSDAMLDNQRLVDDAQGELIHAPAGFEYYWRNQQTGEVIGTNTADPPDYANAYTPLRKPPS